METFAGIIVHAPTAEKAKERAEPVITHLTSPNGPYSDHYFMDSDRADRDYEVSVPLLSESGQKLLDRFVMDMKDEMQDSLLSIKSRFDGIPDADALWEDAEAFNWFVKIGTKHGWPVKLYTQTGNGVTTEESLSTALNPKHYADNPEETTTYLVPVELV